MDALATDLRKRLEKTICEARTLAEAGAKHSLEALAVDRARPYDALDEGQKALRTALRAHGRQLGDAREAQRGNQEIRRLVREVAYEHWHRMLFARFLAENDLLIEPTHRVAVTLAECEDLARELGGDPWALAASFAERMLPQIFRSDDPALRVSLPPETRQALERLLADLPSEVFTADDALGWTYQFWQAAEKDAVNARVKSGEKITGETLPAVTQLFTEPYMVQFLLHNTLGAWHAGKVLADRPDLATSATSEQELRDAVALPGYAFEYLRFVRDAKEGDPDEAASGPWRPAAGTYPSWPRYAREIMVLDPCCGSGHFLVAALDLLSRLRMAEEGMGTEEAIRAALAENIFGLELDLRCTQIAAFHLALVAWKRAGRVIELPSLHLACSGLGPNATKDEWLALAEQAAAGGGKPVERDLYRSEESLLSAPLKEGLAALCDAFTRAPEMGSLIDPRGRAGDLYTAGFERLEPLLGHMLSAKAQDEESRERAVAAHGMARAAQILTGTYTLVVTNVPYLGRGSQSDLLKDFAESHYTEAKNDLATIFVSRMLRWIGSKTNPGTIAVVTPQSWLFQTNYRKFRVRLLSEKTWVMVARLGAGAFEAIGGHIVNVALIALSHEQPPDAHVIVGIDATPAKLPEAKASLLRGAEPGSEDRSGACVLLLQEGQKRNPGSAIQIQSTMSASSVRDYFVSVHGLTTGDNERLVRRFWELADQGGWTHFLLASKGNELYQGREAVIRWSMDDQSVVGDIPGFRPDGRAAWGRHGVGISRVGKLTPVLYTGELFSHLLPVLIPRDDRHLVPLVAMTTSEQLGPSVRSLNPSLSVDGGYLEGVPFDLEHWMKVAQEAYPNGLPEPQSHDPTQWLFHGHPAPSRSHAILQVAVARLLGYHWPAESDGEMLLAQEARRLVESCEGLEDLADADGIVCLPSVHGEATGVDRLRDVLARAFARAWSAAKEQDLLQAAGERFDKGRVQPTLEEWLRERFFVEHCALFHSRPFVWHVWDGRADGFHALVNYHRLAGKEGEGRRTLETLTFTYLGEWIDRQRQHAVAGEEGADGRLAAALVLQGELQKILDGEPPYDLFVRWKPLHEQPLGWDPDIDDGVRLNIRPFLMARDVRVKNAGVLRAKPDSTWSNAKKAGVSDRGREPQKLRPKESFPWFWGCDPEAHPKHQIDFGCGSPDAAPAGREFTGVRWNGLHYTRAAKEAARAAAARAREAGVPGKGVR